METGSFEEAQLALAKSLIGCRTEKLMKSGLIAKIFGLFIPNSEFN